MGSNMDFPLPAHALGFWNYDHGNHWLKAPLLAPTLLARTPGVNSNVNGKVTQTLIFWVFYCDLMCDCEIYGKFGDVSAVIWWLLRCDCRQAVDARHYLKFPGTAVCAGGAIPAPV